MEPFKNLMPETDINEDSTAWYSAIKVQLDHHAPFKRRRVKSKRLPEWFNEEILESRKQREIYSASMKSYQYPNFDILENILYISTVTFTFMFLVTAD